MTIDTVPAAPSPETLSRESHPADRRDSGALAVRLRGVAKSFDRQSVLQGVDLDIPSGQFVAIVGRSGCGKSTLLRLIAGLETPTAGEIVVGNGARLDATAVRLMFQEPRLLPWARIGANVEVGLTGRPVGRNAKNLALETLASVGLAERAGEWPSVLSGGQKQRIALARALVSHPGLLALDEPLGALDALTRIEMQDLIERVWMAQGFTSVLVTHDVTEAVALADRVVVLHGGRIAEDVSVDLSRPRRRGDAAAAAIEGHVLDRLLDERGSRRRGGAAVAGCVGER
jgi:sulfonate transport system ATP-binding protein